MVKILLDLEMIKSRINQSGITAQDVWHTTVLLKCVMWYCWYINTLSAVVLLYILYCLMFDQESILRLFIFSARGFTDHSWWYNLIPEYNPHSQHTQYLSAVETCFPCLTDKSASRSVYRCRRERHEGAVKVRRTETLLFFLIDVIQQSKFPSICVSWSNLQPTVALLKSWGCLFLDWENVYLNIFGL